MHTRDEIQLAEECGAALFLVNEVDAAHGSNPGSTGPGWTGRMQREARPEGTRCSCVAQARVGQSVCYSTHARGPCLGQRDRATGRLVRGHASALAPALPPDATCLACGGIQRIDQVRALRRAGYD